MRAGVLSREIGIWVGSVLLALHALPPPTAGASPAAQSPPGANAQDPLAAIARWSSEYRRLGSRMDPRSDAGLAPALDTLRIRLSVPDPSEEKALIALCDLASIVDAGSEPALAAGRYVADARECAVRDAARDVLRGALDATVGEARGKFLATRVLATGSEPLPRRIAVAEALIGRHWDSTLLALFTGSAASERGLREACVSALSGWKSETVDNYLGNFTLRALREPGFLSTQALFEHFAGRSLPANSPAALDVAKALSKTVVSLDWREALRTTPLTRALPRELAVPQLIEALCLWKDRGQAGASSRRVEGVIVGELELRSGKKLGMAPDRWSTWWKRERARNPDERGGEASSEGVTEASGFFGLHPYTDRVVFVIDRSGSMAAPFGTERKASRYNEALRELNVFLEQLGPRTRFNVILFSDDPRGWSDTLKPATPAMIDSALRWARSAPPQGGTMLRPAIDRALAIDPRTGVPVLSKLEADTVIVLCDGATAEGSGWVRPLMQAVREDTCIRFDCVQIGNGGNGTLEALAAESGGQFVCINS